jgi:hypothetical protein
MQQADQLSNLLHVMLLLFRFAISSGSPRGGCMGTNGFVTSEYLFHLTFAATRATICHSQLSICQWPHRLSA